MKIQETAKKKIQCHQVSFDIFLIRKLKNMLIFLQWKESLHMGRCLHLISLLYKDQEI